MKSGTSYKWGGGDPEKGVGGGGGGYDLPYQIWYNLANVYLLT